MFARAADRERLAAIVADRSRPQKHVWRGEVVLLTADRVGTSEIMRRTGLSKPSVWRWQERYLEAGVDGLLHDKTRPARVLALAASKVIRPTLDESPQGEATHWTVRAMAKQAGSRPARWIASGRRRDWRRIGCAASSCSWLNAVEGGKLTRRRLKRGVFRSIVELQTAFNRFIEAHNHYPKPFIWTADPQAIIAAAKRGHRTLETIH